MAACQLEFGPESSVGTDAAAAGDVDATQSPGKGRAKRARKASPDSDLDYMKIISSRRHSVGTPEWLRERRRFPLGPSTSEQLFDWPATLADVLTSEHTQRFTVWCGTVSQFVRTYRKL